MAKVKKAAKKAAPKKAAAKNTVAKRSKKSSSAESAPRVLSAKGKKLVLVGKTLTYDTGGYSLKQHRTLLQALSELPACGAASAGPSSDTRASH